jgi:hypothetical protein
MAVAATTVPTIRCSQFIADSRQLVHFIFHSRSIVPQYRQYEIIQGLHIILAVAPSARA